MIEDSLAATRRRDRAAAASEADAAAEIARIESLADVRRVAHRGRGVCWRGFGDGPPLVLLHGGHGSWLHWVRSIEPLAAAHRVWLPDMPGFGDSDDIDGAPHAPDRFERLLDALAATLDAIVGRGAQIGLVGFSFGGLVAAHLAGLRGGVERLALCGPGGHATRRRQHVELADWRLADREARIAALRANLTSFMLHGERRADALALTVHARSCEATRFRSKAISRAGGLHAALQRAGRPLLALWGEHDVTADPPLVGPSVAALHAQSRWHVLPDAGHWVQYETADAVNALLARWFGAELSVCDR